MPHDSAPGIPTLTQRAEPTLATDDTPNSQDQHDEVPTLTDIDDSSTMAEPARAGIGNSSVVAGPRQATSALQDQNAVPMLAETIDEPEDQARPSEAGAAGGVGMPQAAFSAASGGAEANMTVLRTALQAELEQALQLALDDAAAGVRARLEAELPTLIARALSKVRPG